MKSELILPGETNISEASAKALASGEMDATVTDLTREMHKKFYDQLAIAVENGKKKLNVKDFFVVVATKNERLTPNLLQHYYFPRYTCPTPNYDQIVYRYQNDELKLVWVIPDRGTAWAMIENKTLINPEHYGLLGYIMNFADGSLLKLAKELNGENKEPDIKITVN